MDLQDLSWSAIEAFRSNFSVAENQQEHLQRCWRHQNCQGCLRADDCSWCPFTWSCVPNSYKIPMLAPAYDEDICPHWAERWEIRTQPLGCQVSTITSLTSIISIVSTAVALLLVFATVAAIVCVRRYVRDKRKAGGWAIRWPRILKRRQSPERDPLLPQPQGG